MKKAQGFILIILFVACGVMGILLANKFVNADDKPSATQEVYPTRTAGTPGDGQTNLVLLRVNDLSAAEPKLVSIWIAFLGPADYPGLTVMMLYPNPEAPEQVQALADSFTLGVDKLPLSSFWQQLSAYKFSWDGYLLADSQSISSIAGWINNTQSPLTAAPANSREGYLAIQSEETAVFRNICTTLENTDKGPGTQPDWGSIIPIHLRTDLTFENMMYSWGKLNPPGAITPCYILGNP